MIAFSLENVLDGLLIVFGSGNALLTWKPQRPYSFLAHLTLGPWLCNKEGCYKNRLAMARASIFSGSLKKIATRSQMSDKLWSGLDWGHLPSLQVISFRRLLTRRGISESQLMIAAWPKQSATPATGKVFMDWLAWSFRRLFEGQAPEKGKDGRAMEGGRLVIWNGLPVILASHTVPATFFVVGAWQTKRRK